MLALGYDRTGRAGTILLGAGIGCLTSTLNPFAIGVASSAADVSIGDGIALRLVMWLVLTTVTIPTSSGTPPPCRRIRRPLPVRIPPRGPVPRTPPTGRRSPVGTSSCWSGSPSPSW